VIAADAVMVSTTRTFSPSSPAAVRALSNVPESLAEICRE
jgi:hypothetical protein